MYNEYTVGLLFNIFKIYSFHVVSNTIFSLADNSAIRNIAKSGNIFGFEHISKSAIAIKELR